MLTQAAFAYLFDPKVKTVGQAFEKVNWWQVGRSSAEGLIPWKTPGGKLGKAAVSATGDVLINALSEGSSYSKEDALKDFSIGLIGDLGGGEIGDLIATYGSKNVAKGLSKLGFDDEMIENVLTGKGTTWKGKVDYSELDLVDKMAHTRGVGKPFTTSQRDKIKEFNKKKNNGKMRSDENGDFLKKGKAGGNDPLQAEVDHIVAKKNKKNPGTNKYSNAALISKESNGKKSNK